jgi:CubicO group peptidase (beta-lactamase class C family)
MMRSFVRVMTVCVAVLYAALGWAADPGAAPVAPTTLPQLQARLADILKETHVPGVSVAIVRADGPEWIGAVGKADVASGREATGDTLFRIGSTSKAFVSLSLLQLVEAGKVNLNDPVSLYLGDQWFQNPWEATAPTRVVDLLEHATGWDDMHFREYAKQAPGMSLEAGLDYDHTSRVARWRPGTRMAYCNSGLAVAALIVEKVSGQRFEDYVRAHLFAPLGMNTATYLEPDAALPVTTLYHDDGKTAFPYWHILLRPAGSINASARDMAAYVAFYLHRGDIGGHPVVSTGAVDRMEVPTRTWAAQDGLTLGYGLSNYGSIEDGFVFHGHDGGVNGGLTQMAYLKDHGVGYFFSINAGNGAAFKKISEAVRGYVTHDLQKPAIPAPAAMPAFASEYVGWYRPDSPRSQNMYFVERLMGLTHVGVNGDTLTVHGLTGPRLHYVPVEGRTFRRHDADAEEPIASLALITPNAEGRFIASGMGGTLKQVALWQVVANLGGWRGSRWHSSLRFSTDLCGWSAAFSVAVARRIAPCACGCSLRR